MALFFYVNFSYDGDVSIRKDIVMKLRGNSMFFEIGFEKQLLLDKNIF